MEWLPVLQGLSTPILLVIGGMGYRGLVALHGIDKRLTVVEYELRQHRLTEEKKAHEVKVINHPANGNSS